MTNVCPPCPARLLPCRLPRVIPPPMSLPSGCEYPSIWSGHGSHPHHLRVVILPINKSLVTCRGPTAKRIAGLCCESLGTRSLIKRLGAVHCASGGSGHVGDSVVVGCHSCERYAAGRLASFRLCGDHGDCASARSRRTFVVSVVVLLCPCRSSSSC